jgi:Flp pilus assembly protein TadG
MPRIPLVRSALSNRKGGQAILESFGIMMLLCLILFGIVQYVIMLTATEIVQYSADASARARAVGFNRFMVYKVNRVASIANAGRMTFPGGIPYGDAQTWVTQNAGQSYYAAIRSSPSSRQYSEIEQYNIPLYLASEHYGRLGGVLDYEEWDTVSGPVYTGTPGITAGVVVQQDFPLRMPFLRAFSDGDSIRIRKEARLADHADYYLE